MSNITAVAELFFDACETGKGWEVCKEYCHSDATFSAQATALTEISNLEGYTEWMKGLLTPIPDGNHCFCCISWYALRRRRPMCANGKRNCC